MRLWRVPKTIFDASQEIKCGFLRGFFDSEGCVGIGSRRITAISTNGDGIEDVRNLLTSLGIKSRIRKITKISKNRKACYALRITGRQNIVKYRDKIGFVIKRKQIKLNDIIENYKIFVKTHEEIEELRSRMIELRNKNMSYEKIAKELNIGTTTVWVHLKNKHKSRN